MRKRCYIYTRVSTVAQTEGYSLEAQQERLREYADYRDLEIAGEYCDAGKSGKSIAGRPAFLQMLEDISSEKDEVSYVLVFKLSRFGRNAADILKSLQLLEDYEVDLICVEDAINSSTAGGRLTLAILSAVAEIERENINVQFLAGKQQKLMDGGWPGGSVPYGYKNVNGELVIAPEEAEHIRLIYMRYLQEDGTVSGTAVWMNESGYSRAGKCEGKPFTRDFIASVLRNPIYQGKLVYNRRSNLEEIKKNPKAIIECDGIHEAIISAEQWEKVQEKREAMRARVKPDANPERISLLSGLLKCPCCGKGMIMNKSRRINKNYGGYYKTVYSYACKGYRKSDGRVCDFKHTYNQEKIDNAVCEVIGKLVVHGRFEKALSDAAGGADAVEASEKEVHAIRKELYHREHEKNRLGEVLDNLDPLSDDYDESYDALQEQIDQLYDQMEQLELRLRKAKKKQEHVKNGCMAIDHIRRILRDFTRLYDKLDCSEKRALYRCFIDRIEVYPEEQADGRLLRQICFKIPIRYKAEQTIDTWLQGENDPDDEISFVLDCSELPVTAAEAKATYAELKAYILEHAGMKVSTLYIAQVKRKYGIDVGRAYNKPEQNKNHVPVCPVEKEQAILEALKAFRMLPGDTEYKEKVV